MHATHDALPGSQINGMLLEVDVQRVADNRVETFVVQRDGNVVDARLVDGRDHGVDRHVAEQRNLALQAVRNWLVTAADDDVGLNAARTKFGDRVLGGFGLLLARRREIRHQREVHVTDVVTAGVSAELSNRLYEGHNLDVADRAADLHDHNVGAQGALSADSLFNLVGDVGNHLDGLA